MILRADERKIIKLLEIPQCVKLGGDYGGK